MEQSNTRACAGPAVARLFSDPSRALGEPVCLRVSRQPCDSGAIWGLARSCVSSAACRYASRLVAEMAERTTRAAQTFQGVVAELGVGLLPSTRAPAASLLH